MSWNYRLSTHNFCYKDEFPPDHAMYDHEDVRLFSIIEVYYKDGEINGYADNIKPLANWEELNDVKGTVNLLKLALDKPILDLDNWPNEYKPNDTE